VRIARSDQAEPPQAVPNLGFPFSKSDDLSSESTPTLVPSVLHLNPEIDNR